MLVYNPLSSRSASSLLKSHSAQNPSSPVRIYVVSLLVPVYIVLNFISRAKRKENSEKRQTMSVWVQSTFGIVHGFPNIFFLSVLKFYPLQGGIVSPFREF